MELTPQLIYFIDLFDRAKGPEVYVPLTFAVVLLCFCGFGHHMGCRREDENKAKFYWKCLAGCILLGILLFFIPSGRTLAAMYVIPAVANNEKVKAMGDRALGTLDNSLTVLEELTGKWIKDLRGTSKTPPTSGSQNTQSGTKGEL